MSCSLLGLHKEPVGTNFISFGYLRDGGCLRLMDPQSRLKIHLWVEDMPWFSPASISPTIPPHQLLQKVQSSNGLQFCTCCYHVCVCSASVGIWKVAQLTTSCNPSLSSHFARIFGSQLGMGKHTMAGLCTALVERASASNGAILQTISASNPLPGARHLK